MRKVEVVVTLRMTFDPHMDEVSDVKQRILDRLDEDIKHGHFEGCEHGAHLEHFNLNIATTNIE